MNSQSCSVSCTLPSWASPSSPAQLFSVPSQVHWSDVCSPFSDRIVSARRMWESQNLCLWPFAICCSWSQLRQLEAKLTCLGWSPLLNWVSNWACHRSKVASPSQDSTTYHKWSWARLSGILQPDGGLELPDPGITTHSVRKHFPLRLYSSFPSCSQVRI